MKVIVAGSREITDFNVVASAITSSPFYDKITEIVCGNCRGIDMLGSMYAKRLGIPVKFFPADWDKHGKAAGPIRNKQMAEYGDALILIWNGESAGSASMRRCAQAAGIPIFEKIVKHVCLPSSR